MERRWPSQPQVFTIVIPDADKHHGEQRLQHVAFPALGTRLVGNGGHYPTEDRIDLFVVLVMAFGLIDPIDSCVPNLQ
jgi:hypothetical protein